MAKSTDRTNRPSGIIHSPKTGKIEKIPPRTSTRPKETLAIREAGTGIEQPQSFTCLGLLGGLKSGPFMFRLVSYTRKLIREQLACRNRKRAALDSEPLFLGSSAVEQPAVNRLVVGSNPTRGATYLSITAKARLAYKSSGTFSGAPPTTGARPNSPNASNSAIHSMGVALATLPQLYLRRYRLEFFLPEQIITSCEFRSNPTEAST